MCSALGILKMPDEAKKFIADYKKVLNSVINEVDVVLDRYANLNMSEFMVKTDEIMIKLGTMQKDMKAPELDLYMPCHGACYMLTRKIKPEKIVETGVQKGGTSYMFLKGLDKNNVGNLWSIDIGKLWSHNGQLVSKIGPLVDEDLKSKWHLIRGDAQKVLEATLEKTGQIDMYCAGQGHTYAVQKHEGELSWKYLKSGGIFLLDRPDWNDGQYLREFMDSHGSEVEYHHTFKESSISDPFEFSIIVKK